MALVLYEALFRLLYSDEEGVLSLTLQSMAGLLPIICHNPLRHGSVHHDDVMRQVTSGDTGQIMKRE